LINESLFWRFNDARPFMPSFFSQPFFQA